MNGSKDTPIRIGVAGLGRAFTLMLPALFHDPRVGPVGATDANVAARRQFALDFGAPAFDSVEALGAHGAVQAVYVATPHHGLHD